MVIEVLIQVQYLGCTREMANRRSEDKGKKNADYQRAIVPCSAPDSTLMKISIQDMAHQQPCTQSFDDNDIYALVHQKGVKRMRFLCKAYRKKNRLNLT